MRPMIRAEKIAEAIVSAPCPAGHDRRCAHCQGYFPCQGRGPARSLRRARRRSDSWVDMRRRIDLDRDGLWVHPDHDAVEKVEPLVLGQPRQDGEDFVIGRVAKRGGIAAGHFNIPFRGRTVRLLTMLQLRGNCRGGLLSHANQLLSFANRLLSPTIRRGRGPLQSVIAACRHLVQLELARRTRTRPCASVVDTQTQLLTA